MKKGKRRSKNHLSYNIEAVGKYIKVGRGEGDGKFREENQDIKKWGVGKNIKL